MNAAPHGEYIHPCRSHSWRDIVLLDGPDDVLNTYAGLIGRELEADVSGILREERNTGASGTHVVLVLESVANAKPYAR